MDVYRQWAKKVLTSFEDKNAGLKSCGPAYLCYSKQHYVSFASI